MLKDRERDPRQDDRSLADGGPTEDCGEEQRVGDCRRAKQRGDEQEDDDGRKLQLSAMRQSDTPARTCSVIMMGNVVIIAMM